MSGIDEISSSSDVRHIEHILNQVFHASKFNVNLSKRSDNVIDINISSREDNTECLKLVLFFQQSRLYIHLLTKCTAGKGYELLNLIDAFAKLLPSSITRVELVDLSYLEPCDIEVNMSIFKILTKGMSWYNEHGYVSPTHEAEREHNLKLINSPFIVVLHQALGKTQVDQIIQRVSRIIAPRSLETMTVKDCLQTLMNSIVQPAEPSAECDAENKEKSRLLSLIVKQIAPLVMYKTSLGSSPLLTKQIHRGGKRRRMQTKRCPKKGNKKSKRHNKSKSSH
jgi:hypothetical protein